jgi:hypothetical protein
VDWLTGKVRHRLGWWVRASSRGILQAMLMPWKGWGLS